MATNTLNFQRKKAEPIYLSPLQRYLYLKSGLILSGNFDGFKEILVQVNEAVLDCIQSVLIAGYVVFERPLPSNSVDWATADEFTTAVVSSQLNLRNSPVQTYRNNCVRIGFSSLNKEYTRNLLENFVRTGHVFSV